MPPNAANNGASLIDAELVLPRLSEADADEDAVTLAAEAALALLDRDRGRPDALLLATTDAPYDEGGNVQPLAELLGLAGSLITFELTATDRDGLAALRLACLLAARGSTALVCAAARTGGVALLVGRDDGIARITPLAARAEELRDRWRLAGARDRAEADPSFAWEAGIRASADLVEGPAAVVSPGVRAAARAEHDRGGPVDPLPTYLGAAHAPARVVLGLDGPQTLVVAAGGLAEAVLVEPAEGAATVLARARDAVACHPEPGTAEAIDLEGISPYASAPRSWRERGQDLRLEGARCASCGRLVFPFPARCPQCGSDDLSPQRLVRTGVVVTWTRDHAYPVSRATGMAVVDLDDGARFYGQVVPSGTVEIGRRVRLVPRRLHLGGGAVQYFWKVTDADRG